MKSTLVLILSLTLLLLAPAAFSQGRLEVTVTGIRSLDGTVRVGLFNEKRDFPQKAIEGRVVWVTGDSVIVVFERLDPGKYGLSVVHDENNNEELDTNTFGIPKEGFAFGNNAMGMFGPPSFEKASVTIGAVPVRQEIRLRYF